VRAGTELSPQQARWLAIGAQLLGRPRPKAPITRARVRATIEAIGTVQLDAINVVERTQFIVLFSRLGAYDPALLHDLTGPNAALFEYWGHAASLMPMAQQPLFRWRMAKGGIYSESESRTSGRRAFEAAHAEYIASVLDEIRARGPLPASKLTDPRRRDGEWWDRRSFGRQTLEFLFANGAVAGWRAPNFERVYDMPERVIPSTVLAQRTPSLDDAHRALVLTAARALGVATIADLASYYVLRQDRVKRAVTALVAGGELVPVSVEGWRAHAFAPADARVSRPTRATATLLSPFDSLIWDRSRTARLFGFDFRIEVYTPAPKRTYGYYVLPLLLGDELVGRFDLKADRKTSTLRVVAAHLEAGADATRVAPAARAEFDALASWLGLDHVHVARNGNLARELRRVERRR
jgi:uncharacterized protein YcaQ